MNISIGFVYHGQLRPRKRCIPRRLVTAVVVAGHFADHSVLLLSKPGDEGSIAMMVIVNKHHISVKLTNAHAASPENLQSCLPCSPCP